ncbi:MAG: hypothetical protein ACK42L_04890, partial [Thermoanaerobaculum sp.]
NENHQARQYELHHGTHPLSSVRNVITGPYEIRIGLEHFVHCRTARPSAGYGFRPSFANQHGFRQQHHEAQPELT